MASVPTSSVVHRELRVLIGSSERPQVRYIVSPDRFKRKAMTLVSFASTLSMQH
jgi:hypothetical protein